MSTGRVRRLLAAVALTLPATGALLAAGVPQASAAVTAPGNGTVFSSYASFEIVAEHGPSGDGTTLTLTPPGGAPVTVGSAPADRFNGGSIRYRLDLGCWTFPSSECRGGRLAPNGTWNVQQSGGTSGSSTFVTRIAPLAPTGVSAQAVGAREVRVRWDLGPEPDLVGWALYEGPSVVKDGIGLSSCDGGSCSTTVSYAGDAGGTHTYSLRALRSVEPGSGSTIESPMSDSASATVEQAPASPPASDGGTDGGTDGGSTDGGSGGGSGGGSTDGGSGGGGTGGTGGGTGGTPSSGPGTPSSGPSSGPAAPGAPTGGDEPAAPASDPDVVAVEQRKAFALGFTSFGPKLGIPKLPPLPQAPSPEVAPELGDGTFAPTLGFEDQVVTERVEVAGSTSRVRGVVGSALDAEQLARSTAGALVLLLAGAHLRRWLGSASAE